MQEHTRKWFVLGLLALAQFMIVLDISIVNVALPSIQKTLHFDLATLQTIVTVYTLAFGGFLLLGGRAADLYGRRRVFIAGVVGFTAISLLIGITESATFMVTLRALQGFCAAFMSPAALSIVLTTFREGNDRNRALSVWGAVSAAGATVGLLIGGILTEYLSWRWNFFVNVPVGIFVVLSAMRFLPAHAAEERSKTLDLPGAVLVTSGLMLLVFTLSRAEMWGWFTVPTIGLLLMSIVLLASFVLNESLAAHPLVPLSIFRIGNIAAANGVMLLIVASLFSAFFFLTLYLQTILHYTPLQAGLSFLPMSLMIGMFATLAPQMIKLVGFKPIIVCAPLLNVVGLLIFAQVSVDGSYYSILPGLLVLAVGMGLAFVAISIAATTGVPGHESGLASGLLVTAQQIGGSIGLAILSTIAASVTASSLATGTDTSNALVMGFHAAFYTGVGFAILASLLAFFFIRGRGQTTSTASHHVHSTV